MDTPLRHTPLLDGTLQNLFYPPVEYDYFREPRIPFSGDKPFPRAAWASDAAMLAYARYGARHMDASELDANFGRAGLTYELVGGTYKKDGGTIADWNAHGTQAIFASCPDFAICSFRGTEKDDFADAVSDIYAVLAPEHDYRPASQDSEPAHGLRSFLPCLAHRGFQHALNQVWDEIHTLITNYRATHPQKEICLTGHSLGAALAVLTYSRFVDPDMSLFTFGCPRVGNSTFRDRALSNPGRGIYRFVNYNDLVTHIPTEGLFYRQTPEACYRLTEDGNLEIQTASSFTGDLRSLEAAIVGLPDLLHGTDLNREVPPSLVDHSPARYCFRLWDFIALPPSNPSTPQP